MDGALWFARQLKNRDNPSGYSPAFGRLESLDPLRIRLSDIVTLDARQVVSIMNLYERDADGDYVHLGKLSVLLPYGDGQRYIVIGILQ